MHKQFKWDNKYSVKVPSIDEQHKYFFDLTNQILALLEQPHNPHLKERLILLTVKLGRYSFFLLDFEEDCMSRYSCPDLVAHREIHETYRSKVINYLRQVREEETDLYKLAEEVAEFSQDWLSGHILTTDRDYIDCLEKNGVE